MRGLLFFKLIIDLGHHRTVPVDNPLFRCQLGKSFIVVTRKALACGISV